MRHFCSKSPTMARNWQKSSTISPRNTLTLIIKMNSWPWFHYGGKMMPWQKASLNAGTSRRSREWIDESLRIWLASRVKPRWSQCLIRASSKATTTRCSTLLTRLKEPTFMCSARASLLSQRKNSYSALKAILLICSWLNSTFQRMISLILAFQTRLWLAWKAVEWARTTLF